MADKGQQTEQPTARRIEKARREGRYPAARELVGGLQFLAVVAMLAAWGGEWFQAVQQAARSTLRLAFNATLTSGELQRTGLYLIRICVLPLGLAGALLLALTLAARLATTRMGVNLGLAAPRFGRLNPMAKLRELPRQNLPALVQAAILLPLFGAAVYYIVRDNLEAYLVLPLQGVAAGARQLGASVEDLLWKAAGLFLLLGCVDFVRQRRRYLGDLRMSKQEIRDEAKELEGNPQVKMRIRRLQRELLRRQMMQQVPKATAVIVNPTHYAVAIRYQLDSMAAPTVVAKGRNYLALRIRQRALEHQVPIMENPPLAQALYKSAQVGQQIPAQFYRAVAEILAYIYRLMNGRLPG